MEKELDYIRRKSMLYPTGVEYGDYSMNHVLGCSHGCKYPCYAYLMKKRFGVVKSYEEWCRPKLVVNTIDILANEIPRLRNKIKSVNLCFTTDPFMYGYPDITRTSMLAICRLNDAGIKCTTLTKGITPNVLNYFPIADAESRGLKNEYGITLTTVSETFRQKYEPGAAPYNERLEALKKLHDCGCKTWVSVEPYPPRNIWGDSVFSLQREIGFVDKVVLGRWNYNKKANLDPETNDFYDFICCSFRGWCRANGIELIIKQGTESENQKQWYKETKGE